MVCTTIGEAEDMGRPPSKVSEASAPQSVKKSQSNGKPNLGWNEAIYQVLGATTHALTCEEIARKIIESGLRSAVGATPASTVASYLSVSLREPDSPYLRVSRGYYTLKNRDQVAGSTSADASEVTDEAETGALRAFGMFWVRDQVIWTGTARLVGRQGSGASDVNFADQVGVYLLHDRERVIYVGRATDSLYSRLKAHTSDRLSGRWDRFSWFGLRGVKEDGSLIDSTVPWTPEVVIETMEALLIESLEPPLNRKRGDNFSAVEFIQVTDPQLAKAQKQALLEEIKRSMGLG
jgi:hypothetical protein